MKRILLGGGEVGMMGMLEPSNSRFDGLAAQQLSQIDVAQRTRTAQEMQRIVADDVPAIPLYVATRTIIFDKTVLDNWYYATGARFGSADPDRLRTTFSMKSTQKDFMRVYGYDNERFTQLTAEQLVTMDKGRRTESPKNSGEWWRETCCPFPCR